MRNLETIVETIRAEFEATHEVREATLKRSRELIRICAKAIRAMHREEWDSAEIQLKTAEAAANTMTEATQAHPDIYHAGYTQDSLKEYVEARITYALMQDDDLPTPQDLNVLGKTWLNGLTEAATEQRRRILDILRRGHSTEAERLLTTMDDIYSYLVTYDFPDSITGGLRRRTDTVRAVLERTRGDVTNSIRQSELQNALRDLEAKLTDAQRITLTKESTMAKITVSGETFETQTFEVADGTRLTKAIEAHGIDILHRCGGHAKCTTCKVTFNAGEPSDFTTAEKAKIGDDADYRLSCQILCSGEMDVNVLATLTSSGLDDAGPELSAEIPA